MNTNDVNSLIRQVDAFEETILNSSSTTVETLQQFIPLPGDSIHLLRNTADGREMLAPAAYWNRGDEERKENWEPVKTLKQTELCRNVRVGRCPNPLLHQACSMENTSAAVLEYIIQTDPDALHLRCSDYFDREYKPLHCICTHGEPDRVKLILKKDPSVVRDNLNPRSRLPIHCLMNGRILPLETLQILVDAYPESLAVKNDYGDLPLHAALCDVSTFSPSLGVVQYMVEKYPESLKIAGRSGFLPIHLAAYHNRISFKVIQYLVQAYPESLQIADQDFKLPLHRAILSERHHQSTKLQIVHYLASQCPSTLSFKENLPLEFSIFQRPQALGLHLVLLRLNPSVFFNHVKDDMAVGYYLARFTTIDAEGRRRVRVLQHLEDFAHLAKQEVHLKDLLKWMGTVGRKIQLGDNVNANVDDGSNNYNGVKVHECIVPLQQWATSHKEHLVRALAKVGEKLSGMEEIARISGMDEQGGDDDDDDDDDDDSGGDDTNDDDYNRNQDINDNDDSNDDNNNRDNHEETTNEDTDNGLLGDGDGNSATGNAGAMESGDNDDREKLGSPISKRQRLG